MQDNSGILRNVVISIPTDSCYNLDNIITVLKALYGSFEHTV